MANRNDSYTKNEALFAKNRDLHVLLESKKHADKK